jgi:hypothetical protein
MSLFLLVFLSAVYPAGFDKIFARDSAEQLSCLASSHVPQRLRKVMLTLPLTSRGLYIGKYPPPPQGGGNKYGLMGKKYHENNARADKKGEKERKDKGKEKKVTK